MLDNFELPNEVISKAYDDIIHPAASEIGKTFELIPRAINAALAPLETWILKKEYNINQVKIELGKSLSTVDPNKIVSPDSYVAVPALQAISYSMSNKELCSLYANLLAKSMVSDTKERVHPAFVEIIKQLSPNDALVLKSCSTRGAIPVATLSIAMLRKGMYIVDSPREQQFYPNLISDIIISSVSEEQIRVSLDNLMRIGLVQLNDFVLKDYLPYSFVESSEVYSKASADFERLNADEPTADCINIAKKCLTITELGEQFCNICINGF